MKKQNKQIFNPLSGGFDTIHVTDATKDLGQVLQLTADDSASDWTASPSFQISKTNPLQGDASYALAMTAGDKATHKGVAVNPVFRQRTLALVMSYKGVSVTDVLGTAKVILRDQADAIIYEAALPTITSEIQKFGDRVFIPSTVTSVKFEIEATSTVADESIQFDSIELSSDLLKSVDINDKYQHLYANGLSGATVDLSVGAEKLNSKLFSVSGDTITSLTDNLSVLINLSASGIAGAGGQYRSAVIRQGGVDLDNGASVGNNSGNGVSASVTYPRILNSGESLTLITGGNAGTLKYNYSILATARTKSIVAPTDQVSEKSMDFRWRSAVTDGITEANLSTAGKIGDYVTGQYAPSSDTLTQCTTRPTSQTDAQMSVEGVKIFTRAYNAASTAASPSKFVIKIAEPNQMAACDIDFYKNTSTPIKGSLDVWIVGATMIGTARKDFNPKTGLLTIDLGHCYGINTITVRAILFEDGTSQTNGYLTFTASKLAQAVAIPKTNPVAIIKDVKPSGTNGGTFTAGSWQTRDLNTLEDPFNIVTSLSVNQFTLSKGRYLIEASAPAYSTGFHKVKLRDVSNSLDLIIGSSSHSHSVNPDPTESLFKGVINLARDTAFEVQHISTNSRSSDGFGRAGSFGVPEVYSQIKITKLD